MGEKRSKPDGTKQDDYFPHPHCIHAKNGITGIPKDCTLAYECRHCAFDQWLDAMEDERDVMALAA